MGHTPPSSAAYRGDQLFPVEQYFATAEYREKGELVDVDVLKEWNGESR